MFVTVFAVFRYFGPAKVKSACKSIKQLHFFRGYQEMDYSSDQSEDHDDNNITNNSSSSSNNKASIHWMHTEQPKIGFVLLESVFLSLLLPLFMGVLFVRFLLSQLCHTSGNIADVDVQKSVPIHIKCTPA